MPFYDDEQVKSYTTDFGSGQTLTIKLKPHFDAAPVIRRFIRRSQAAVSAESQIEKIQGREKDEMKLEEFQSNQQELERWEAVPDRLQVTVDVIFETGKSWDRYATRADEEAGNPVPFTRENIANLGIKILAKVADNLMVLMGFREEEDSDPKASSTASSSASPHEVTVKPTSPTGLPN